jgi:hypothetical protein
MKRSGLILSYYTEMFPQGLRKTTKTLGLSSAGLLDHYNMVPVTMAKFGLNVDSTKFNKQN